MTSGVTNMFWPMVLPAQITFFLMVAFVICAQVTAIIAKWKPPLVFVLASLLAFVAFIPSCVGVTSVLDTYRFGIFQYATYSQVQDFRVERYLPPAARQITLEKTAMGHRAMYHIEDTELKSFLDEQWQEFGQHSAISRDDIGDGETIEAEQLNSRFSGLGWPLPKEAIVYHSVVEADGGGAQYYVDTSSGLVFQHAGYW